MTSSEPPVEVRRARPTRSGRARHLTTSIAPILAGVGIIALASALPDSRVPTAFAPSWWPTAVGAAMVVLALVVIVRPADPSDAAESEHGEIRTPLLLVGCSLLAVGLWAVVGFLPAMVMLGITSLLLLGSRRPLTLALLPLAIALTLFAFFGLLLRVPL